MREIGRHVQGEPVPGDPLLHVDPDARDLAPARPYAGVARVPLGGDAELRECGDERFLEGAEIPVEVRPVAAQVEDRITHQLPGPVERDVAAALDLEHVDAFRVQQVGRPGGAAQRDHGWVLEQQEQVLPQPTVDARLRERTLPLERLAVGDATGLDDPNAAPRFQNAVRQVYERLDAATGQIIAKVGPDASVFVVSDHGGGPVSDRKIFLNRYLAQLGLLHYRVNKKSAVHRIRQKIIQAGFSFLRSSLPHRSKAYLATLFPTLRKKAELAYTSFASIDWNRTKAYCSEVLASPPSICINLKGVKPAGIVDPADYVALTNFIIEKLHELKDPRTGQPVIGRVYRREEIIHGPFANEGADLVLDWWSENSQFATGTSFPADTDKPPLVICERRPSTTSQWGGTHRLHGIVIARGPAFKSGAEIANARLIDIAPTLLHLLDVPVPEDMDGKVLTSFFHPDFLSAHAVRAGAASGTSGTDRPSGYTDEESAKVEERLQALGYLE